MKFEFVPTQYEMNLDNVSGVALDSRDNLYLSIRARTPVVVFDKAGAFVRAFGTDMMKNAHGIAVDGEGNVLVVDRDQHCVFQFDPEGELKMTLGTPGQPSETGAINGDYKTVRRGGAPFNLPSKVAVGPGGDLFVADGYANARIHRFDRHGRLLCSWGEPGPGPGQFRIAHGVGVDPDTGDVYVGDRENERIQVFTPDGALKAIWNDIFRPTDIFVRDGYVYVAELGYLLFVDNVCFKPGQKTQHSVVRVFDRQGREQARLGTRDIGADGSFFGAHGVHLDSRGDLYVSEVQWWLYGWAAWPRELPRPSGFHPLLQKFRRVD